MEEATGERKRGMRMGATQLTRGEGGKLLLLDFHSRMCACA